MTMTVKFSEMCAVRTDLAGRIEAAFANYREEIARGYGAYLAPAVFDGETEIDTRHQLVLLARKVEHHRQRVVSLDEGVLAQIQGDEKVRAEIDQRTSAEPLPDVCGTSGDGTSGDGETRIDLKNSRCQARFSREISRISSTPRSSVSPMLA